MDSKRKRKPTAKTKGKVVFDAGVRRKGAPPVALEKDIEGLLVHILNEYYQPRTFDKLMRGMIPRDQVREMREHLKLLMTYKQAEIEADDQSEELVKLFGKVDNQIKVTIKNKQLDVTNN